MADVVHLKPTLHVEVLLYGMIRGNGVAQMVRDEVAEWLSSRYSMLRVDQDISGYYILKHGYLIDNIEIVDFTGPVSSISFHKLTECDLDVQAYLLHEHSGGSDRRIIQQEEDQDEVDQFPQARIITLPSKALNGEWNSLVFDDNLPARLLRYMTRMISIMKQPGLNLATFNWNRLCLLHGPPGSGKSTLCRALAQKLTIRLGDRFACGLLVEINSNALLSKYFSESGKLIGVVFQKIHTMSQDQTKFICVVMDEVETIAGSRERSGNECNDGVRATNQLLTALDLLRHLPNVIVLCTSNLISAIDPAFVDRVDIKQFIPSPSPAAIYNIFRSCLNELIRSSLIDAETSRLTSTPSPIKPTHARTRSRKSEPEPPSSTGSWQFLDAPSIPTFAEMKIHLLNEPQSAGRRVWTLAQKCQGLSGRTLRRLPILGLAMYTWGGDCKLEDAVSALEAAVEQEFRAADRTGVSADDLTARCR